MPQRETIGKRIQRQRAFLGWNRATLAEKVKEIAGDDAPSESFIRDLEQDRFPSPGIQGVAAVARALNLPPIDLIQHCLEEPVDEIRERGALEPKLKQLKQLYEHATSTRERALVEETIQMLIRRLGTSG